MDEAKTVAVKRLKEYLERYITQNYRGKSVEVDAEITTEPDIITNQTILALRFQVKRIVEDKQSAMIIDAKNVKHEEKFRLVYMNTGEIIDG